jgi:hypothetical protein
MEDVIVGLLAVAAGALFCFRGYLTMRLVIPAWGALVGFLLGAGVVAQLGDDDLLATVAGWLVGALVGVLFGLVAYLYYEVSVVVGMAGIGFSLGTAVMVALGVRWSWLVILVGVLAAIALAAAAILVDLPMILLVLLSATGGAVVAVGGLMLLFGAVDLDAFDAARTTELIDDSWYWYGLYTGLVIGGILVQLRDRTGLGRGLRQDWADAGGRQFRSA